VNREPEWPRVLEEKSHRVSPLALVAQPPDHSGKLAALTKIMADVHSPEYWRELAAQARALAATMTDPAAKRVMVDAAISYENVARRAEGLALIETSRPGAK